MKKIIILTIGLLLLVAAYFTVRALPQTTYKVAPTSTVTAIVNTFSYKGENGRDALTLLKEKTPVEQNNSGLVVAINNRKADDTKHEFWAFFVNGKEASVGPASYQTKNTDTIEWKIEKY